MACVLHPTQNDVIKRCTFLDVKSSVIDLDLTQGYMYYLDMHFSPTVLKSVSLNFSVNEGFTKYINYDFDTRKINSIAVDWVNGTIYAVIPTFLNLITSGQLNDDLNHEIKFETIFKDNEVKSPFNSRGNRITVTGVQVDPYERAIFFVGAMELNNYQIGFRYQLQSYIFKFDTTNENLTVIEEIGSHTKTVVHVNVNGKKVYILHNRSLRIYNYEGHLIQILDIPISADDFVVFMDVLYVTVNGDSRVYLIPLNETNLPLESYDVIHHGMNKNFNLTLKLLDARSQRQMNDGQFICDRTDCPYLCEVRPEGDTCVCPKRMARNIDGKMCYECGQSNLTLLKRQQTLVNTSVSHEDLFPWHAVFYHTKDNEPFCGGTLISTQVVLTAAHCVTETCDSCRPTVTKGEEIRVAFGKRHRSWNLTEPYGMKFNVTEMRVNGQYLGSSINYANDIALVFLDSKVSTNEHIQHACLDYNLNQLPSYKTLLGYVPGFGFTEEECGSMCSTRSDDLKYTTTKLLSFKECVEVSNSVELSGFGSITSDKFCIENASESAVQKGDSGSGLTLEYRGIHFLSGIVSVNPMKGRGNSFRILTNISDHMEWIKHNLPEDN